MNRVYSKTFQQGSQTSFSPGSLFSPHYLALFGYMIHFFQPNFSLSNLYLFFLSFKPQKRYSFALNYSEVFQRLRKSTLKLVSGWLLFTSITLNQEAPQIKKLPKSRTSANWLHWPIRHGCLLNKNSERLMAAGNALIEKDSNNHTTQA